MELQDLMERYKDLKGRAKEEINQLDYYTLIEKGNVGRNLTPEERRTLIDLVDNGQLPRARESLKVYHSEHSTRASDYLLDAIAMSINYFDRKAKAKPL